MRANNTDDSTPGNVSYELLIVRGERNGGCLELTKTQTTWIMANRNTFLLLWEFIVRAC